MKYSELEILYKQKERVENSLNRLYKQPSYDVYRRVMLEDKKEFIESKIKTLESKINTS